MTLKLEQKKAIVAEVAEIANRALSVVAVEYRGMTASDMIQLRTQARAEGGLRVLIARNTLVGRALQGTSFECLQPLLLGPVLLVFSSIELSAAARLIKDFKKTNEKLKVKALS